MAHEEQRSGLCVYFNYCSCQKRPEMRSSDLPDTRRPGCQWDGLPLSLYCCFNLLKKTAFFRFAIRGQGRLDSLDFALVEPPSALLGPSTTAGNKLETACGDKGAAYLVVFPMDLHAHTRPTPGNEITARINKVAYDIRRNVLCSREIQCTIQESGPVVGTSRRGRSIPLGLEPGRRSETHIW